MFQDASWGLDSSDRILSFKDLAKTAFSFPPSSLVSPTSLHRSLESPLRHVTPSSFPAFPS